MWFMSGNVKMLTLNRPPQSRAMTADSTKGEIGPIPARS